MKRIPEPELMLDSRQVEAYAKADFEEAHSNFIKIFNEKFSNQNVGGLILDLGCGPGDITFRFAEAFPDTIIHAIDGSLEMLFYAKKVLAEKSDYQKRIQFINSKIEDYVLDEHYEFIISNSLLHHLPDPMTLWDSINRISGESTNVFVMDLLRPASLEELKLLVEKYAYDEPDILKRDFHRSLLSAFSLNEVEKQIEIAEFELKVEQVSDRHFVVYGSL